jgi:nicotinamidase/pyrazinamidase
MWDILIVSDMQTDFISGVLGTPEAVAALPRVIDRVRAFTGPVLFIRDTHGPDYLDTQEGSFLPVLHCARGSEGWMIHKELEALRVLPVVDKSAFGSLELGLLLRDMDREDKVRSIMIIGLCTDFCVISNAFIAKAVLPEARIIVDAACCAGATPEGHRVALSAMKVCQVIIENELPVK